LIDLLLQKDPNLRPSIEEILAFEYVELRMKTLDIVNIFCNYNSTIYQEEGTMINTTLLNTKFDNIMSTAHSSLINGPLNSQIQETIEITQIRDNQIIPKQTHQQKQGGHKKYSPSYGVNEMGGIMKHLKINCEETEADPNEIQESFKEDISQCSQLNETGLSKNQFSVPELHGKKSLLKDSPEKLSMEESIIKKFN
jgi:hypothetical protein